MKPETPDLPPLLFEMLKSFSTLAATQNLSQAVIELNLSRQTIRRHVVDLEAILGKQLLQLENRRYELTLFGAAFVEDAATILSKVNVLMSGVAQNDQHLMVVRNRPLGEGYYLAKQQTVLTVREDELRLVAQGYQCWCDAKGRLDHARLQAVSPFLVIYRQLRNDWTCIHVGERSALATWLGVTWAKSQVGTLQSDIVLNKLTNNFVTQAYAQALATGAPRLDHIATQLPRGAGGQLEPINYHRLLLPCRLPDSKPVLAILTVATNRIDIGEEPFEMMDEAWCMEAQELDPIPELQ